MLAPGGGKAGGVVFADTPREAHAAAAKLLGAALLGMTVEAVLVEERLAITFNALQRRIDVLMSRAGRADVEAAGRGAVQAFPCSSLRPLEAYRARELARALGLGGPPLLEFAGVLHWAFALFRKTDARLLEINPLVRTPEGRMLAADAAEYLIECRYPKPVVAFIAGRFAQPGFRYGHAGAIVERGRGTHASKVAALSDAGVAIATSLQEIPALARERLGDAAGC